MGLAIDSILSFKNTPGTAFTATAVTQSNDPLQVRDFGPADSATLECVVRKHATSGGVRILSPLLHDNVNGDTWYTDQVVSTRLLPDFIGQPVQRGDTLTIQCTGDTVNELEIMHRIYYSNLPGADAKLHMWGDIAGNVKSLKALEVDVTASGTVGAWSDTAVNTTDKQLHATSQYAVLGYVTDTPLTCVGIKGQYTANLRVCGPGSDIMQDTAQYFVQESQRMGTPHIPVFNGIDQAAVFVSVADTAASTAAKITLMLAELIRPFS